MAISAQALAGDSPGLRLEPSPYVHAGGVKPDKKWLLALVSIVDELHSRRQKLLVDCFHALFRQRASVIHLAVGITVYHATRPEVFVELRIFRVVRVLRLILRVQMIEVAEELIEAVVSWQVFIPVAKMILAELSGSITERF